MTHANKVRLIVILAVSLAAITFLGTAAAQKASVPKPQDRLAMGEENVKQLLLLMDTDKNGMVSKQDYMHFMEAEFQRLDKSNQGQLNARQLKRSSLSASRFAGK
jgi:Ca2+-binding EF-hand superfamily protein